MQDTECQQCAVRHGGEFQRFVTPLKEALEAYRREQKGKKEASEQKKKNKDKKKDSEEQDKSRDEDNDEDEERLEEEEQNEEEEVDNWRRWGDAPWNEPRKNLVYICVKLFPAGQSSLRQKSLRRLK